MNHSVPFLAQPHLPMGSDEDPSFRRDFIFPRRHQPGSLPNPIQLYLSDPFLLMVSLFSFIIFIASCRGLSTTIFPERLFYAFGSDGVCSRTPFPNPTETFCYNLCPHQTSTLLHDQLRLDHERLRSFTGAAPTAMGSDEDSSFRRDFIFLRRHQPGCLPNPIQLYLSEPSLLMVSFFSFIIFIASCRGLSTTIFLEELLYALGLVVSVNGHIFNPFRCSS